MSGAKKPRDSKVRHVFGTAAKSQEIYNGIKFTSPNADANPLIANKKYFAFPWKGKGGVCVVNLNSVGAVPDDSPLLSMEEPVSDLQFNPFNDNVVAISGDTMVNLWKFDDEGIKEDEKPMFTMENPHEKRMVSLHWHPLAENVLLTTSVDKLVKLWDVEKGGEEKGSISGHEAAITSMSWDLSGNVFATTSKDKKLRIIDPRQNSVVAETICHEGAKAARGVFLTNRNQIATVGFIKGVPEREIAMFDPRNLSGGRVGSKRLDAIPSSIFPYYDPDLSLLYLIGKGDGNIRIYEIVDGADPFQESGEFKSSTPQAGFAMLPKLSNDVMKCEIGRVLKLQDTSVVPIRFGVTRQNSGYLFQSDLYPDTWDCKPVYSSSSWFSGETKNPTLVPVTPPPE